MFQLKCRLAGALLFLCGLGHAAQAAPLLYVYEGAGCTGLAGLTKFENMLGRKVDGVVDFNDYTQTPANAVTNLNWALGCWKGNGRKLAISIGLAFNGLSTADIAAGKGDAMFQQMGASLVSHGFGQATVRLGWEMNGNWYGWGQKGAVFASAFSRAAAILHATPGSGFTIGFNPGAGLDPSAEMPGGAVGVDQIQADDYASSWNSGGAQSEPALWTGDDTGYWGFQQFYSSPVAWWPGRPAGSAVPEFGVGSRADGHGACPKTGPTDCDDPYFMSHALAAFNAAGVAWIGYWDYDAGDYNARVSDGTRPGQALELLKAYGGAQLRAALAGSSLYAGATAVAAPPAGQHQIVARLAGGRIVRLVWGEAAGQTVHLLAGGGA